MLWWLEFKLAVFVTFTCFSLHQAVFLLVDNFIITLIMRN